MKLVVALAAAWIIGVLWIFAMPAVGAVAGRIGLRRRRDT